MDREDDEATPLLRPQTPSIPSIIRKRLDGLSPAIRIVPVLLIARFAAYLPTTTTFQIVRDIACLLWYTYKKHDPNLPSDCNIGPVNQTFAAVMMVLGIMQSIGTLITMTTSGYFATRYGRKPVILTFFALFILSIVALLLAQALEGPIVYPLVLIWLILHCLTDALPLELVINMYVIDVIDPNERTAFLSILAGWGVLGISPSFLLGGVLSSYFKDVSLVFYTSAVSMALAFVYVLFLIPESFPKSKRDLIKRQREDERSRRRRNPLMKLLSNLVTPFESLRLLKPIRNPSTGRKSYRLVWCGLHAFVAGVGEIYTTAIVLIYLITERKFSPAETGLGLTIFTVGCVLVLLFVVPTVRRHLTPFYTRPDPVQSGTPSLQIPQDSQKYSTTLDVHIAFGSWVIGAVALVLVGISKTKTGVYLSLLLWSLCAGRMPVFKSLVACSVEPALQAEALSAVHALLSAGGLLSPIVLGSVFTWTINSLPLTVFFVHGAVVIVGASFLFLIRDEEPITGIVAAEAEIARSAQG
ncbi:hypothetical protein M422DRAFT_25042 [Sphaerobolus stellatus SS14]|nr:hypothetical protein M422DRAFT_25042 [Sphaerobolus stellatus SS14]